MKLEQGSTLIMVLIILLLVTILGTVAVKSSLFGLTLSTNHQVSQLLLENNDAVLFNIEDQTKVARQLASDGMFGYLNAADNSDELVFCYRAASTDFFSLSHSSVISSDGVYTKNGINGFCKATQFATGRSALLSQVYLRKNTTTATPLSSLPKGSSVGESGLPVVANNISVTVISVLPSFANASSSAIEACFKKTAIKKTATTETVEECFSGLNIPYNTQHADYIVGGQPALVTS